MATARKSDLRFTHLRLERWRNFSKVDIDLAKRAFLVGPNASGKSNLLDAFRFLRDIVVVGGGFQEAVRARGGVPSIRSLSARRPPEILIEAIIGDDDEPRQWLYRLRFNLDAHSHQPVVVEETVEQRGTLILKRPRPEDSRDPQRLSQTSLEQVNSNQEFRELADFFASVRYLHIVPQLIREPDRSIGRRQDPYGGDFLEQLASTPDRTRTARLRKILEALQFAVPQLKELAISRDIKGVPHLVGKYEHWRPTGAYQSEDRFSDGTLRLLGLLWALLERGGPLLLEEPELSLHAEVTRYLPQMFAQMQRRSGRQILLSTHSEALLNDSGIGLDEIFLLTPEKEGTRVTPAGSISEIRHLLEGGFPLGEAVLPRTRPTQVEQLTLFSA